MNSLVQNKMSETSILVRCALLEVYFFPPMFSPLSITLVIVQEVSNIDGRICVRLGADSPMSFEGLLLSR